jgi:hypothetical protein
MESQKQPDSPKDPKDSLLLISLYASLFCTNLGIFLVPSFYYVLEGILLYSKLEIGIITFVRSLTGFLLFPLWVFSSLSGSLTFSRFGLATDTPSLFCLDSPLCYGDYSLYLTLLLLLLHHFSYYGRQLD